MNRAKRGAPPRQLALLDALFLGSVAAMAVDIAGATVLSTAAVIASIGFSSEHARMFEASGVANSAGTSSRQVAPIEAGFAG